MAKNTKAAEPETEATETPDLSNKVNAVHEGHAAYIADKHGVEIDPLHVFLIYSTRVAYRKTSDQYQEAKQARLTAKEEAAQAKEAKKARKAAEREAAAKEKAEKKAAAEAAGEKPAKKGKKTSAEALADADADDSTEAAPAAKPAAKKTTSGKKKPF